LVFLTNFTNSKLRPSYISYGLLVVVYIFLSISTPKAYAADIFDIGSLHFETIGNEEKIGADTITAILQDERGFIWLGTQHGLVRYDGYRFVHYTHDENNTNSLGGNYIRTLALGKNGQIWVGTNSDGVSVLNPHSGNFSHYRHDKKQANTISHDQITALVMDEHGNIWVGTNNGLNYIAATTQKITRYFTEESNVNNLKESHVRSLLIDKNKRIWVGSWNGLNYLDPGDTEFQRYQDPATSQPSLTDSNIFTLFQTSDSKIWIGTTDNGAGWIEAGDSSLHWSVIGSAKVEDDKPWIITLAQPNPSELWIGTNGKGIFILDADNGTLKKNLRHDAMHSNSINYDGIGSLFIDDAGLIWIGTWGGGLNLHNPNNTAFRSLYHSPNKEGMLTHADIGAFLEIGRASCRERV